MIAFTAHPLIAYTTLLFSFNSTFLFSFFPLFIYNHFFFLLNTNSNQLSVSEIACGVLSKKQYSTTIMGGRDDLVAFSSSEVLFYFLFMKGRFKGMTMEQRTQVLSWVCICIDSLFFFFFLCWLCFDMTLSSLSLNKHMIAALLSIFYSHSNSLLF